MAAADQDPKPVHGTDVEMVENAGDTTSRDGDDNKLYGGGVIPSSAMESFSEKGRRILGGVLLQ